jgi:hypothetical protein
LKLALIAASGAALAVAAFSVPAFAQDDSPAPGKVTWYGNLGYTGIDADHTDLSAIDARVGARFGRYWGVEGEGVFGVDSANIGGGANVRLNNVEAIYGVGYLPIRPNLDLFARVGYGGEDYHFGGTVTGHASSDSWNYGAGAQWFWDGKDGVRGEYTRVDSTGHDNPNANTWSIGYVRRF